MTNVIDLSIFLGEYQYKTNPLDGTYYTSIAVIDYAYIFRGFVLLIGLWFMFRLMLNLVSSIRK